MKLATIEIKDPKNAIEKKDGRLVIIDPTESQVAVMSNTEFPNMISVLEDWGKAEQRLKEIEVDLQKGRWNDTLKISDVHFKSPLPRAYSFLDGSAYLTHVKRVRKSRGAEMPQELEQIPLMYQGINDHFLAPDESIPIINEEFGVDFEAEIAVLLDEVPLGVTTDKALSHIKLIVLLNDISLRNLIPAELARGFGFLHGKPTSSFAPYAVTPSSLGNAWKNGKLDVKLKVSHNGRLVGDLNTGEMHFSFPELIAHAAKTRKLSAGTILGSGTVSNNDESHGIGCLVEQRVIEIIKEGAAKTQYLKEGDEIIIEAFLGDKNIFGSIKQKCIKI